jgi:O-antigen ligase
MSNPNAVAPARTAPPPRWARGKALREPLALATLVLMVAALVLGGVNRSGHHLLVQLAALPAFYLLLRRPEPLPLPAKFACGALVLGALQLVPLPHALWTALPGRELAVQVLEAAGRGGGWRSLSLDPGATAAALSLVFAPLVAFLAVARLPWPAVRSLLGLVALLGAGLALLGVMQRMTGGLSVYGGGHTGYATGLMINRNHHADVIVAAILLLPLAISPERRRDTALPLSIVLVLLFVSVAATTSRAGILLALPALALALAVTWRVTGRRLFYGALAMAGLAALLATLPQFQSLAARFAETAIDDRTTIADSAWVAMRAFWPWGSGYGTFVPVYAAFEDLDRIHALYVTAAHNDYLQLLLEGGIAALATILGALLIIAHRGWALRSATAGGEQWLPFAVAIALLVHSWPDYPLRMSALSVLLGACLGAVEALKRGVAKNG